MKNKNILSVLVTLGLVLAISSTVLGVPSSEMNTLLNQKEKQQQQISKDQNDLSKVKNQSQSLETELEIMDSQIEGQMRTLDDNKNQVEITEKQIENTEKEIEEAEIEIKGEQTLFDKRMRVMYINGADGYIGMLLDSKNFGDFYLRVETLKKVVGYDTKIINDFKDKREVINNKKAVLVKKNSDLLALKLENEKKMSKLNETKKSQNILVIQFKSLENELTAKIKDSNSSLAYTGKKIDSLSRSISIANAEKAASAEKAAKAAKAASSGNTGNTGNSVSTPSTGTGSSATVAYQGSDAVVAYAFKFLNTPYLWGGTRPYVEGDPTSGFDCSGFLQYVYAHFGVAISRVTYDQVNDGVYVPKEQLRAGDLVFFGNLIAPHHVGMYIGNGQFIHAPHTGDVIKVSDLATFPEYITARRVK